MPRQDTSPSRRLKNELLSMHDQMMQVGRAHTHRFIADAAGVSALYLLFLRCMKLCFAVLYVSYPLNAAFS